MPRPGSDVEGIDDRGKSCPKGRIWLRGGGSAPARALIERLNAGLHRKLTLVSAPAGFGRTTVLSR